MSTEHSDLSRAMWRKSSHSGGTGGQCVEVALNMPGVVAVRDSKAPEGQRLVFKNAAWLTFAAELKAGTRAHG